MKIQNLGLKDTKTRSMALKEPLDISKTFSTTRNFKALEYNQKFEIEDLTSVKIKVIDSIQSLFDSLTLVYQVPELDEFKFICNWASLTSANKLIQYSKSACHELNIFLYYKDRPFFNQYIAQFLQNKMHKDFVDKWLLGEDLSEYCNFGMLWKLPIIEQLLFV